MTSTTRFLQPQRRSFCRQGGALTLAVVLTLVTTILPSDARAQTTAQLYKQAMDEYERNHWQAAFSRFSRLADGGDAQSARMALRMRRFGPQMFGMSFEVNVAHLREWSVIVAEDAYANCDVPDEEILVGR